MSDKKFIKEEYEEKLFLAFDFANEYLNENETFENYYNQKNLSIQQKHIVKNIIAYKDII